jgi:UDP-N-acetyl-D-glucosamine dehydrogenase
LNGEVPAKPEVIQPFGKATSNYSGNLRVNLLGLSGESWARADRERCASIAPLTMPVTYLSMPTPVKPLRIAVIGQGYVGLPLAMRAFEVGHDVIGIDLDANRVRRLNDGDSFIEDVESSVLKLALASGRYGVSTDVSEVGRFDIAVITVPTPLRESLPDLRFIESAAGSLAPHLTRGATVILESTTYPGTTRELLIPILEKISGFTAGTDFSVGYSPERIDPGNRTWTFVTTPKVVSGLTQNCLDKVTSFYAGLIDRVVPIVGLEEAELTKLLENTFRHVNIALVNELAVFARELGVDLWAAIDAASTKPFGYMRFTPGPGVGGHCLPIDPSYLSWRVRQSLGKPFRFVELANDVNEHMPDYVVRRILLNLNRIEKSLNGSKIVALGVAYKRNSSDARETPAIPIINELALLGAQVTVVDPFVTEVPPGLSDVTMAPLTDELLATADLVLLLTDHELFNFAEISVKSRRVFDTRNRFPAAAHVELL